MSKELVEASVSIGKDLERERILQIIDSMECVNRKTLTIYDKWIHADELIKKIRKSEEK